MITREMNKLKKRKITSGKIIISLIFVCMSLLLFYTGIKKYNIYRWDYSCRDDKQVCTFAEGQPVYFFFSDK